MKYSVKKIYLSIVILFAIASMSNLAFSFLIHDVVEEGNLKKTEALLKRVPGRANQQDNDKLPLNIAARKGNIEMVKLLLEYGAYINPIDVRSAQYTKKEDALWATQRISPINAAAAANQVEMTKFLISQGAEHTLLSAVLLQDVEAARKIIEKEPLILKVPFSGFEMPRSPILQDFGMPRPIMTPLEKAICLKDSKMARLLIEKGFVITGRSYLGSPLHVAIRENNFEIAELLIKKGAPINDLVFMMYLSAQRTPLHEAAITGNVEMIQLLLAKGADMTLADYRSLTPLRLAAMEGNKEAYNLLADQGVEMTVHDLAFLGELFPVKKILESNPELIKSLDKMKMIPLHAAAMNGQTDIVIELIELGSDPNALDNANMTPLAYAAMYNHIDTAKILLKMGAKPNGPEISAEEAKKRGRAFQPVLAAIEKGNLEMVRILADAGATVNQKGARFTQSAIESDNLNLLKYLLEKGADPNSTQGGMSIPIRVAIKLGKPEIVRMLLDHGADSNIVLDEHGSYSCPLNLAIELKQTEMVKMLIEHGADIKSLPRSDKTSLAGAIEKGNIEIVKLLLDKGCPIVVNPQTQYDPFHAAAEKGDTDIINLLLEKGAPLTSARILSAAAGKGNIEALELLLEKGVPVLSDDGNEALANACRSGSFVVVEFLLSKGVDVNAKGERRFTPLHAAAENNRIKITELLISKGALTDVIDRSGKTPLQYATEKGYHEMAELLAKTGKSAETAASAKTTFVHKLRAFLQQRDNLIKTAVNFAGKDGLTPLHNAVRSNDFFQVRFLIENGADVNALDKNRSTPLHFAIRGRKPEIIKLLLDKGADKHIMNNQSLSPYILAQNAHSDEIIRLFQEGYSVEMEKDFIILLRSAVEKGQIRTAASILKENKKMLTSQDLSPLLLRPVLNSDREMVEMLLDAGADSSYIDENALPILIIALEEDNIPIACLLIERGADIDVRYNGDAYGNSLLEWSGNDQSWMLHSEKNRSPSEQKRQNETPLHFASRTGYFELAEPLVKKGADLNAVNVGGTTPLEEAAVYGWDNIMRLLLDAGANQKTPSEKDPLLHFAVRSNNAKVIGTLLARGYDKNVKNKAGETPLHLSLRLVKTKAALALLNNNPDVNAQNNELEIPLHYAVRFANYEILDELFKHGCKINMQDNLGKTALHYAVEGEDAGLVTLLLEHKASPKIKDKKGLTPLDYTSNEEIKKLLSDR